MSIHSTNIVVHFRSRITVLELQIIRERARASEFDGPAIAVRELRPVLRVLVARGEDFRDRRVASARGGDVVHVDFVAAFIVDVGGSETLGQGSACEESCND